MKMSLVQVSYLPGIYCIYISQFTYEFLDSLNMPQVTLLPYIYCKVDEKIRLLRWFLWRNKGQKLSLKIKVLGILEYFL